MAVAFKIGIRDLLPEFLANALVFLGTLKAARAVTTGTLQAFLYGLYYFCIFVESDSHRKFLLFLFIIH